MYYYSLISTIAIVASPFCCVSKKGDFSILNYFLIVFLLSNVLFLISFSVNTFLFCELNSFVYDQIESRVAFFLDKTWTCRE